MQEKSRAIGTQAAVKQMLETFNGANVRNTFSGTFYIIEDGLFLLMTPVSDDGKRYKASYMAPTVQAVIYKPMYKSFNSKSYESRFRQTIDGIVSSLWYSWKLAE